MNSKNFIFMGDGRENWAFPYTAGESVNIYISFLEGNSAMCTESFKIMLTCSPFDPVIICPCMPWNLSSESVCVCVCVCVSVPFTHCNVVGPGKDWKQGEWNVCL